ncbi:hypothetical protein AMECASPLE_033232 [Ameca splendens]|uniref:Uncharacterized protein n=1 Tax=Ameca splendens TaxID=208324 RepID=A0ABV0YHW8_9TELE
MFDFTALAGCSGLLSQAEKSKCFQMKDYTAMVSFCEHKDLSPVRELLITSDPAHLLPITPHGFLHVSSFYKPHKSAQQTYTAITQRVVEMLPSASLQLLILLQSVDL